MGSYYIIQFFETTGLSLHSKWRPGMWKRLYSQSLPHPRSSVSKVM